MKKFKIKSFCKINLNLRILKKLNNGHHNIKSLITFCDLHDVISISQILKNRDVITFSGKFKSKINIKSNTVQKTLYLLRKRNLLKKNNFRINVQKNIPHGSGLGGGSSNAANLINFLNLKMKLKLNKNQAGKIARKIGFDVPINLEKKNTLLTGNMDQIIRVKRRFNLNILIVYPNIVCSTKMIYLANKTIEPTKPQDKFKKQSRKKLISYLKNERNDLQKTVFKLYPKVKEVIKFISIQNGCNFARITGSGSACIGIFSNMKSAIHAKKLVKIKFPKYWCVVSKTI
jgi:4-diphosphocytidyl-2-C-methyl-D-erythritol kinase